MRKIEPEFITGMGYIGASPGVLYRMGGAGEQTVVTGNPALLEGVKGNRFTSLTLHGKSSQKNTTGAQLFPPPSLGSVEKNGITLDYMEDGKINIRGTAEITTDFYVSRLQLSAATYTLSVGANIDKRVLRVALCDDTGIPYLDIREDSLYTTGTIESAIDVSLLIRVYAGKSIDLTVQPMLNIGSAALPYEPYTGGKPSPSPEYPQEIKSAGQGKTIGVEVRGKNLLNPLRFFSGRTHNGITWTVKNNGEIVCEGTALGDSFMGAAISYPDVRWLKIPAGRYVLSGSSEHVMVYINTVSLNGDGKGSYYCQYNSSIKCVFTEDVYISLQAMVRSGETAAETVCPQFESGDTATSYEPYHEPQFASIATPNGLPGIPVSSGGNYTDEKGQQWVADEIDLAKGERVQRIGEYGFTGAEVWNSWGVNKYTEGITGFYWYFKNTLSTVQKRILNTHAVFSDNAWGGREEGTVAITDLNDKYITWSVRNEYLEDISDNNVAIKSLKKMLGEINAKMLYCLAEPIRTPLPPETIAAYKALKTYSPTTTVINDAGAGMSVGYRRK